MHSIFDWLFQLWPDELRWLIVPWAWLSIIVGSLGVIMVSSIAMRHYSGHVPLFNRDTGKVSTPTQALRAFVVLGGVNALFASIGVLLLQWQSG